MDINFRGTDVEVLNINNFFFSNNLVLLWVQVLSTKLKISIAYLSR